MMLGSAFKSYWFAYTQHNYWMAGNILYQINGMMPPDITISDMPPLTPKSRSLRAVNEADRQAEQYCSKYGAALFQAYSKYASEMIQLIVDEEDN